MAEILRPPDEVPEGSATDILQSMGDNGFYFIH